MVLVAVRLKVRVRVGADDEEKLIDGESKKAEPLTARYADGLVVPMANLPELAMRKSSDTLAGLFWRKVSVSVPNDKSPSLVLEA